MQKIDWNIMLNFVENNIVYKSKNIPTEDKCYLCTCVSYIPSETGSRYYKYLNVLEWNGKMKSWNIPGTNMNGGIVLAWADIEVSDFEDFSYNPGGYLTKKVI